MRRLLAALAALAIASGTAAAESPLAGHTLSCSVSGNPVFGGCYYEVPVARLGPLTFSVGLDAQLAARDSGRESYLAPYLLTVLELDAWSAWVEVAAPSSWGIPVIGRSPSWRAGFTWTFR
jgi:hypothetical protein